MSERRETILRLLQDETGRILDVKVEQQPVPVPKYVFKMPNYSDSPSHSDGDIKSLFIGTVMSYKTVGDDETIIPVPFTANGETVIPGASGEGQVSVTFDTAGMEPDPEHPGVWEFVIHLVQEESGETIKIPYKYSTVPYLRIPGKTSPMSYTGGEQTIDVVLKNALYKDLVIGETPDWLHASMDGKQLRVTCDKNFTIKERTGVIKLTLPGTPNLNESVTITQEGTDLRYIVRTSCTDAHLSDDKSRRLVRLRLTVICADQHTGEIVDPDVPWTVTGSDDRVVVESADEAKRELLLSLDTADTLEQPVSVTIHLEDGSDFTLQWDLYKDDLTPSAHTGKEPGSETGGNEVG